MTVAGPERIIFDWAASSTAAANEIIPPILALLRARAPVSTSDHHGDAGRFRDSIGFRKETSLAGGGSLLVQFVSVAPYAKYILEGTSAGATITPKNAAMLRWRQNAGFKFAPVVTRGATQANDFNVKVGQLAVPIVKQAFKNSITFVTV